MLLLLPAKIAEYYCVLRDILFLFSGQCEVQSKAKALKVLSNPNTPCVTVLYLLSICGYGDFINGATIPSNKLMGTSFNTGLE